MSKTMRKTTRQRVNNRVKGGMAAAVLGVMGVVGVTTVTGALASSSDHERARSALQAGEIQPLIEILPKVTGDGADRVIEVELERKRGRWIYEFKTIEPNGMVRETKVDAKTAEILETEYDDDSDEYRDNDDDKYGDKHADKHSEHGHDDDHHDDKPRGN
jgi:uncharacterized membrane protein YkoI